MNRAGAHSSPTQRSFGTASRLGQIEQIDSSDWKGPGSPAFRSEPGPPKSVLEPGVAGTLAGRNLNKPPLVLRFRGCASCCGTRGAAGPKRPEFRVMLSKMGPTIFDWAACESEYPAAGGGEGNRTELGGV